CDFKDFVAQSHTPDDHCVRFAVVVTFPDATLVTKRALPLTWAGLSPAGSRQLRLAHRFAFADNAGEVARAGQRTVDWCTKPELHITPPPNRSPKLGARPH